MKGIFGIAPDTPQIASCGADEAAGQSRVGGLTLDRFEYLGNDHKYMNLERRAFLPAIAENQPIRRARRPADSKTFECLC